MKENLSFTETEVGAGSILAARGRVDSSNAGLFEEQLVAAQSRGPSVLIIDFTEIEYMSSAGLRVLLMTAKKTKAAGSRLILCGLSDHIREVFDVSGFSVIFTICDTREDALSTAGL